MRRLISYYAALCVGALLLVAVAIALAPGVILALATRPQQLVEGVNHYWQEFKRDVWKSTQ